MNEIKHFVFRAVVLMLFFTLQNNVFGQIVHRYLQNETPTYAETIEAYKYLDKEYKQAELFTCGPTDSGHPLHLFVISTEKEFEPETIRKKNKRVIFINNGIHPGEPCGIDASIKFAEDILKNNYDLRLKYMQNTVVCIVPVFNIGGQLNRSAYHRSNQNGPKEYGFRGNAKNYNLNRDFVKADALNTRSLIELLQKWQPDVFIDTHTSNGADHQYVMTLIATHENLLNYNLKKFYSDKMMPFLYREMETAGYPMIPYVNVWGRSPDKGYDGFMDTPRFASGYNAMFNTISFVTETHMFKPYADRVKSTYEFCEATLKFVSQNAYIFALYKSESEQKVIREKKFVVRWEKDTVHYDTLLFKGYEQKFTQSTLTGKQRYYYDRNKPFEREIPYYNTFIPKLLVDVPHYYIIPQQWHDVIDVLKLSNIELKRLQEDTVLTLNAKYITNIENTNRTYEGHYFHRKVEYEERLSNIQFYKGDYVINPRQRGIRFLIETLELDGSDSFFAWNFFDPILERKEYFSPYVFEEIAIELLNNDLELKKAFEQKKVDDEQFADNAYLQLLYIYEHSAYYEDTHRRYPVFRVDKAMYLPVE